MNERYIRVGSNDYRRYGKGILFSNGCALNEIATVIFDLCDGRMTVASIVDFIYEEYDCDKDVIRNDVCECIQFLLENNIISKVQE